MNGILLNQGGAGAVESVNGQIGDVVLLAAEVGAIHSINGKEGTDIDLEPSDLYPELQINDDRFFYQSQQNVYTVCNIDRDGLKIGG